MGLPSGRETDGELYSLAVSGSREATEMLVNRHDATLRTFIRAKTGSLGPADDAVADAWLKFFDHLQKAETDPEQQLRKPESVRFWLYRTALNSAHSHFRQSTRQRDLAARATSEAKTSGAFIRDPDEFDRLEISERHDALRQAFQQLNEKCRELLSMLSSDPPLAYDEVAEVLGRPIGSIGPTRRRCLEQLRYQLGVAQ